MGTELSDWLEYVPSDAQHEPEHTRRRGRRLISPQIGDAFFVYGEYDDGNGMWIITGVSL
jgi:hypothetical protein